MVQVVILQLLHRMTDQNKPQSTSGRTPVLLRKSSNRAARWDGLRYAENIIVIWTLQAMRPSIVFTQKWRMQGQTALLSRSGT